MQALREIHNTASDTIVIKIPQELRNKTLEIIVLPLEDINNSSWPKDFFNKFVGCLPDFPDIEAEGDYENRKQLL